MSGFRPFDCRIVNIDKSGVRVAFHPKWLARVLEATAPHSYLARSECCDGTVIRLFGMTFVEDTDAPAGPEQEEGR